MDRLTAQLRTRTRILELGAGTGLVSFALAAALRALGRTAQTGEAYDIYATDLGGSWVFLVFLGGGRGVDAVC